VLQEYYVRGNLVPDSKVVRKDKTRTGMPVSERAGGYAIEHDLQTSLLLCGVAVSHFLTQNTKKSLFLMSMFKITYDFNDILISLHVIRQFSSPGTIFRRMVKQWYDR
jgi:hypothetical protein